MRIQFGGIYTFTRPLDASVYDQINRAIAVKDSLSEQPSTDQTFSSTRNDDGDYVSFEYPDRFDRLIIDYFEMNEINPSDYTVVPSQLR